MFILSIVVSSSNSGVHMRLRQVWGTLRYEWWSFLIAVGLPPLVVLISLYRIGAPHDFEVWQYAPLAIPTLALIESVRVSAMQMLATNHLTTAVVWLITRVVTVPQYVFIVVYMLTAITTAATTYAVARMTELGRLWAMVLALVFTLAPARFWFVDIADHWWLSIPVVWLVIYHWWHKPLDGWRTVYRTVLILPVIAWLGWEQLVWSTVALVVAAGITPNLRPDWSWRHLGYAIIPMWLMALLLHMVYPIALPMPQADGLRLLDVVAPHRTHWVPWVAGLGERLYQLEIPRTSTVYGGGLAIVGVIIMTIRAIRQLAAPNVGVAQPLFVWVWSLVLLASISGWSLVFAWVGLPIVSPQFVQLMVVFSGVLVLVQWFYTHQRFTIPAVVLVICVMLIDQVPSTNIMRHMRQAPQEIPSTRVTDGAWFGQQALPADIVSVTGLSTIDPGYGRWSDAAVADRIRIVLREPLRAPVMLEIRARGVGVNIGAPIVVRIGAEEHTMVLDATVTPYLLTFSQPQGTVIEIIPQPVATPPTGDVRRIGIFLQSIRVVTP